MKITLGDLKNSDIPAAIGLGACDARFTATANQAIQRLTMSGELWFNLTATFRISITEGLLTLPRQVAAVETLSTCGFPMQVRSPWFEYVSAGYGLRDKDAYCDDRHANCRWDRQAFVRQNSPLFSDIIPTGNPKALKIYADIGENGAEYVWVFGTDFDGNVLRTNIGGNEWVDGVRALTPTNSAIPVTFPGTFGTITAVNKPLTRGALRLYESDPIAGTQRAIAIYQAEETNPSYRRIFIGDLCQNHATSVQALTKLEFFPVHNNEDNLLLGSLPAIKAMMLSVRKLDQGLFADADAYERKAMEILDREAAHFLGNTSAPLQFQSATWGGGAVPALY